MRNGVGSEGVGVGTGKSPVVVFGFKRGETIYTGCKSIDFGARLWPLNPGSVI